LGFVVTGLYSATLYALGMQRRLFVPVAMGAFVAIVANVALTLQFGLNGAVISYVVAQLSFSWLTWRAFGRAIGG
jgi:O-antigen/teichoic acid export membrane protein